MSFSAFTITYIVGGIAASLMLAIKEAEKSGHASAQQTLDNFAFLLAGFFWPAMILVFAVHNQIK